MNLKFALFYTFLMCAVVVAVDAIVEVETLQSAHASRLEIIE